MAYENSFVLTMIAAKITDVIDGYYLEVANIIVGNCHYWLSSPMGFDTPRCSLWMLIVFPATAKQ